MPRVTLCWLCCVVGSLVASEVRGEEEPTYLGKTVAQWVKQLESATKSVDREDAATALGEMGPAAKSAVPALVVATKDGTTKVSLQAVWALGKIGPDAKSAVPHLREMLAKIKSRKVRREISDALDSIEDKASKWSLARLDQLGLHVKAPSPELVEQLDLPKDQTLVIDGLEAESSASKFGLKRYDILMSVGDKQVPADVAAFLTLLESVEIEKDVELGVLRKGVLEKVTVKLPTWTPTEDTESKTANATYTIRTRLDSFVGTYRRGRDRITVEGKIEDGVPTPTKIFLYIKGSEERFDRINDMPQKYRRAAKKLLPMRVFSK